MSPDNLFYINLTQYIPVWLQGTLVWGVIIGTTLAIIYFTFRSQMLKNYKETVNSQDVRIKSLEDDMSTLTKNFEEYKILTLKEKKELEAQVNQLIGENKSLKDLMTYQDPQFRTDFSCMAEEVKQMRVDFKKHYEDDNRRFAEVVAVGTKNAKHIKEDNNKLDAISKATR